MQIRAKTFVDAWNEFDTVETQGYPPGFITVFKRRADRGDLGSLEVLYSIYKDGIRSGSRWLVRKDLRSAMRYRARSAELGEPEAMTAMANQLKKSKRTKPLALRLYRKAFRKGYSSAASNLALTYKKEKKFALAVAWYRRAASLGDEAALLDVAIAELYGVGTRRNVLAAFAKLRRIARSRASYIPDKWLQIQAMLTMSRALDNGWLVQMDTAEAFRWLKRAASLGSSIASAEMLGH